jgi:hypothetical protein
MNILNALKGIGGEYEVTRVVGAVGALAYVLCANGFVAWNVFYHGALFDVATYCLSFPTGLGVAVGATAGAAAIKDRGVATARVTSAKADTADAANVEASK